MSGADWVILVVVVVLFVLSIFFAAAETAFMRMSRIRAIALAEEGDKRRGAARGDARAARADAQRRAAHGARRRSSPSATLIGVLLEGTAGALGVVIGIVLQIFLFFVIGEVAPEDLRGAAHRTRRAARSRRCSGSSPTSRRCAGSRTCSSASPTSCCPGKGLKTGPVRHRGGDPHDGRRRGQRGRPSRARSGALIHSIFEFGDTVVREVMLPRPDMVGGRRQRHHRRRRSSAAIERRVLAAAGVRGLDRQHHRPRVPQGPRAPSARRRGRRNRCGSRCARRSSCPSRSGSPSCCARCAPSSSTWRS